MDTSDFWAALTLLSFPTASFIATYFGSNAISSFFWGMGASLSMMVANILAEDRLWMFAPKWRTRFEHPEFAFRLALITGALLLILESFLLVTFFTEGSLDQSLINLVFSRQCQSPTPVFSEFCQTLESRYQLK